MQSFEEETKGIKCLVPTNYTSHLPFNSLEVKQKLGLKQITSSEKSQQAEQMLFFKREKEKQ